MIKFVLVINNKHNEEHNCWCHCSRFTKSRRINYFIFIETEDKIHCHVITSLPIKDTGKQQVELFGLKPKQPFQISCMLQYESRSGHQITNDDVYNSNEIDI